MYAYDRAALKQAAKRDLMPVYGTTVLISLIYYAILFGLSFGITFTFINFSMTGSFFQILYFGHFLYGMNFLYTNILRNGTTSVGEMFEGFKKYGSVLLLTFLNYLFIFLWSLLLIIPGIIKSIAYSMSYFIKRDNPTMTATECRKASIELTDGHKGKIFVLNLSFIGWALLASLTLGIGMIFLLPYIQMSTARMYDFLILNHRETKFTVSTANTYEQTDFSNKENSFVEENNKPFSE